MQFDSSPNMRIIMHVDLDAFFPSVEVRANPELKGKPVVVGADPKDGRGRGVVSSASYEARKYGIRSAMPISKAWRLCPDCVYLRPNFSLYLEASNNIMRILKGYADKFEQGGIDEAYLDISKRAKNFDDAGKLARKMMEEVLIKENLTCSVGIGPNKMIAKIASDYKKPFGLTAIEEKDAKGFLFPLNVRSLPGVGPKTESRLKELGVGTIGDLASASPEMLNRLFGVWGTRLHEFANGIDNSEVMEEHETKSVGRDITFERDADDEGQILGALVGLAEEVHEEVIASGFKFKTITVRVRYQHFDTHIHSKSLPFPTDDLDILRNSAKRLIAPFLRGKRKVRLIGLRVSNLVYQDRYKCS